MHNQNVAGQAAGRDGVAGGGAEAGQGIAGQDFRSTSTAFSATSSRRIRSGSRKP